MGEEFLFRREKELEKVSLELSSNFSRSASDLSCLPDHRACMLSGLIVVSRVW